LRSMIPHPGKINNGGREGGDIGRMGAFCIVFYLEAAM